MRILVIGKNGQLGKSIHKLVANTKQNDNFIFAGRKELDLSNKNNIACYFQGNVFDIIINCAAYTAVDKAERERGLANQVNNLAVGQLAQIAKNQRAKLIHISTDYVFDGKSSQPYKEADKTNPINIYGKTKLAGEVILQRIMSINAIIIRTSWLYSEYGNNFVKTMLKLGKEKNEINIVSDQIGSPTYAGDLAEAILKIINNKNYLEQQSTEIYHYSNEGEVSWFDFAKEIFKITKTDCKVKPITTDQYPTPAKRPENTTMSKTVIADSFGISIVPWRISLISFLKSCD